MKNPGDGIFKRNATSGVPMASRVNEKKLSLQNPAEHEFSASLTTHASGMKGRGLSKIVAYRVGVLHGAGYRGFLPSNTSTISRTTQLMFSIAVYVRAAR